MQTTTPLRLASVRPLVRYVDEQRAVIDAHFALAGSAAELLSEPALAEADVEVEIDALDGFHDEGRTTAPLTRGRGTVRFEVVEPERWWPAGMGSQPLYRMRVSVMAEEEVIDSHLLSLGLTSVRYEDCETDHPRLLVNGRQCAVRSVLTVDQVDESQLLPASRDNLLLVRDHYGPEVLYHAADRAGVLLIQCVPIHPEAAPELDVAGQVDRLTAHPSLVGWFVGHLGRMSDEVAARLRHLDPTRHVFRHLPPLGMK